jgi:GH15 family glucan-1,4-alpha-glucosidase
MSVRLEDYAFLSNTYSAALVSRSGSVDWLSFPRFDSPAFFASLLGSEENGCWSIAPTGDAVTSTRAYRHGTLVLDTHHRVPEGEVRVTDALVADPSSRLVRIVSGVSGRVPMRMELRVRFDYGSVIPWVRKIDGETAAVAGADALRLRTPVETHGAGFSTVADFTVSEGDEVPFELAWYASHTDPPRPVDVVTAIRKSERFWRRWAKKCTNEGEWHEDVSDSLVVLKGLSYTPTGGIVAAPTTSLPEEIGGTRNWDYRYCWIRDATFTLIALLESGYDDEAVAWRDWLLRALAGDPDKLQILYSVAGERRLPEWEVPWLSGYEGSAPVRVGNGASEQFQLDVFGESMDALYHSRLHGVGPSPEAWQIQKVLLDFLESKWRDPDEGIWEVRGPRRHFTHSKVMAWVALDRAVRAVADQDLDGPVERWKALRDEIHRDVCEKAVDPNGVFTQSYGSPELDASTLMIPLVGFLPPDDLRVRATVEAIERELTEDGFVRRYRSNPAVDGMDCDEGAFLICSFWLVDNYALMGRKREARELFERLLALRNDVGLLSEQYDPAAGRLVGNFPQGISHVALVITAATLDEQRAGGSRGRSGHFNW